ncbi:MAG: tyrosine-type recombinase/integrase [Capnocytophaga sp.]|nr:tyrosine-type recombinase/integrase [Capnocytophaga sp.]
MPKNQKQNSQTLNKTRVFVDYKPAELHKGKEWRVEYYVKIPAQNEMKRFRKRVPPISSLREREKYAKKIIVSINQKLESGWSPFYEDTNSGYKSVDFCFDVYLKNVEKEMKDGVIRPDTLRAYNSFVRNIQDFIKKRYTALKFIIELDTAFVHSYLDYIYYEKNNSPRTYNNHLRFINTFLEWCKNKRFVNQNATEGIKAKPKVQKKREVLTDEVKAKVAMLEATNHAYYTLCMTTYYCFIRRTELTKIKVSDVNLLKGYILVQAENSKNKKSEAVTIPNTFLPTLALHLSRANNSDYLFSADGFAPGHKQLSPKKISDEWDRFRKREKFDNKFQFYSLKDTGITDLLNSGIPAIKVRDQARHHDLKITEAYTARSKFADETIKNTAIKF